jgi:hypothetical protein
MTHTLPADAPTAIAEQRARAIYDLGHSTIYASWWW